MGKRVFNYARIRSIPLNGRVFEKAFKNKLGIGADRKFIQVNSLEGWLRLLECYVDACPEDERGRIGLDETYLFLDGRYTDRVDSVLGVRSEVDERLQDRYDKIADKISEWMRKALYEEGVDDEHTRAETKVRKQDKNVDNKVKEKNSRYPAEKEVNPAYFCWDFDGPKSDFSLVDLRGEE